MAKSWSQKFQNFLCIFALMVAVCSGPRTAFAQQCTGTPDSIANCIRTLCLQNQQLCSDPNWVRSLVGQGANWTAILAAVNAAITTLPPSGGRALLALIGTIQYIATGTVVEGIVVGGAGGAAVIGGGAAIAVGGAVIIAGGAVYAIVRPDDFAQWLVPSPPSACPALHRSYSTMLLIPDLKLTLAQCADLAAFSRSCLIDGAKLDHASCYSYGNAAAPAGSQPPRPRGHAETCYQRCTKCESEAAYPNGCWQTTIPCLSGTCPLELQPCAMGDRNKSREQACGN